MRARVIGDTETKDVTISVIGDPILARDALDTVRMTFEDMHSAIKGLAVDELIPVPGRPDAPFVGYRHLRALDFNGVAKHFAQGASPSEIIEMDVREALSAVRGLVKAEAERAKVTMHFHNGSKPVIPMSGDYINQSTSGGNFIGPVAGKMVDCTNIINQQGDGELRELLKTLQHQVGALILKLPIERQEEAMENLLLLMKGADVRKPNRRWYSVSAEGLLEASKFVGEFTANILNSITQIGTRFWPDFSLPSGSQ